MGKHSSSRHHYLPVYYVNGFTNTEGYLYVYDKQKDSLTKRLVPPKSIYFEWDRNTIEDKEGNPHSLLEDSYYSRIDTELCKTIADLREKPITKELLGSHNQGQLQYFIIDLFWRNPITDKAFHRLLNEAKIRFNLPGQTHPQEDLDLEQNLKADIFFHRMQRINMVSQTIDRNGEIPEGPVFNMLIEFDKPQLLLGDYPMLFEKTPTTFPDLHYLDYYLPISANRVWTQRKVMKTSPSTVEMATYLNILVIEQSTKYICCSDYTYLQTMVNRYQALKAANNFEECFIKLFVLP